MRLVLVLAIAITTTSIARAQDAQGKAFGLQLFRPAVDSKGYFTLDGSQLLGHLDFSLGLVGTWAHDVLELQGPSSTSLRVSDLITAQLQAALGLYRWAEIGVSLPVHILFGNRAPAYVDAANANNNSDLTFGAQMVGDVGVHAKVRLLDPSRYPLGLALVTSLYLPSGPADRFLGEGNVSLRPTLVLDEELGRQRRVRVALDAGALVRFDRHTFTDRGTTLHDGDRAFCWPAPTSLQPPGTCGTGQSRTVGTQLTYGLAIAGAVVPQKLDLLLEVFGYADVTGSAHAFPLEWLAGAKVYLASKSYFQVGAGTGIVPGQTGSPDVRAFVGFIFEPAVAARHGGRLADDEGPPAPSPPPSPPVEEPAPPEPVKVMVRRTSLAVFGPIHFETAKATIKPISFPTLDAVAKVMKDNPQLQLLEVQGHADERGDDDYNLRLTEERAQAVRAYLIEHGVGGERLEAHGYGENQPVCRRHDELCWSKNRRVEFVILRQEGAIPGQQ